MLESSQVCPLCIYCCTIQGILNVKKISFMLPKAMFFIFNLVYFQDCRELLSKWLWSVSLCAFPPVIRQRWLWLGVLFSDVCMYCMCSLYPISVRTCAHVGGHGLIKRADEKNSMPFVLEKQRLLWIHYFMDACQGVCCGWLQKSRLWGLIKPNSCWFVLVEQSEGGGRSVAVKGH